MTELLVGGAVTIAVSAFTFLLGKGKNQAETEKLEKETEKIEIETKFDEVKLLKEINQNLSDQYEKNDKRWTERYAEMEKKWMTIVSQYEVYKTQTEKRICELEEIVKNQDRDKCLGDLCPTKIEYNKILAKRLERKRNSAMKKFNQSGTKQE